MNADDERHGSNGGYLQHVTDRETACQPCREAHAKARRNLWRKRYVRGVDRLYIDSTGSARRIRALMALGWRYSDIDAAAGYDGPRPTWSHNIVNQARVHVDTAAKVDAVYRQLGMTLGPSVRVRNVAAKRGWAPPLAWDNIDDPNERPKGSTNAGLESRYHGPRTRLDPDVIARIWAGEWDLPCSQAERTVICERWLATGRTAYSLKKLTGWRISRYAKREAA